MKRKSNTYNSISKLAKKLTVLFVTVTFSFGVYAQKAGDKAIGGNLMIGTGNDYSNVGLGAKFMYNVTDPVRLSGEFDYFLKKDFLTMWDFAIYGHYLFPVADNVNLFPAIGLGIIGAHADVLGFSATSNWLAASFGGGADIAINSNLFFTGEIRFKIYENTNRVNIALGVAYKF